MYTRGKISIKPFSNEKQNCKLLPCIEAPRAPLPFRPEMVQQRINITSTIGNSYHVHFMSVQFRLHSPKLIGTSNMAIKVIGLLCMRISV